MPPVQINNKLVFQSVVKILYMILVSIPKAFIVRKQLTVMKGFNQQEMVFLLIFLIVLISIFYIATKTGVPIKQKKAARLK